MRRRSVQRAEDIDNLHTDLPNSLFDDDEGLGENVGFSARLGNAKLLSTVLSKLLPAGSGGGGVVAQVTVLPEGIVFSTGSEGDTGFDDAFRAFGMASSSSSASAELVAPAEGHAAGDTFYEGVSLSSMGAGVGYYGSSGSSVFGKATFPRALFDDFVISRSGEAAGVSAVAPGLLFSYHRGGALTETGCRFGVPLGTVIECLQLFVHTAPSSSSASGSTSASFHSSSSSASSSYGGSAGAAMETTSNAVILSYSPVDAVLRMTLLDDQTKAESHAGTAGEGGSGISASGIAGASTSTSGPSIYTTCDVFTLAPLLPPEAPPSSRLPPPNTPLSFPSSRSSSSSSRAGCVYDIIVRSESFRDALSALWEAARTSGGSSGSSGGINVSGISGGDVSSDAVVRVRLLSEQRVASAAASSSSASSSSRAATAPTGHASSSSSSSSSYLQLALLGASNSCDVLIPGDCSVFVLFPDLPHGPLPASHHRDKADEEAGRLYRGRHGHSSSSGGSGHVREDRGQSHGYGHSRPVVHFEASFPCHALHLALKACDVARETRLRFSGTSAPLSLDDTAAPASSFAAAAAGAGGDGTVGGVGGLDGGRTARGGPALIQHQVPVSAAPAGGVGGTGGGLYATASSRCCYMDFVVMPHVY